MLSAYLNFEEARFEVTANGELGDLYADLMTVAEMIFDEIPEEEFLFFSNRIMVGIAKAIDRRAWGKNNVNI